ncbi:unnamed protein product [Miscanthus lutarioriparius]|uniref:Retrotransposon gag domain-containing protein n=1 Tax=Miscanthus lutarioriparius TaxID=422564 RepID=A0A811MX23_9POAL|nr:unnamed protein product [Miscanthus lutarioriparius]
MGSTRSDSFPILGSANTYGDDSPEPTPSGCHAIVRISYRETENPRHTDWDPHDDDFSSNLVEVTIHNLSQGGTILEQSNSSDESDRHHDMGATKLANTAAPCLSLYDRYQSRGVSHKDVDDDYIILHTRSCDLGVNGHEGNGFRAPNIEKHDSETDPKIWLIQYLPVYLTDSAKNWLNNLQEGMIKRWADLEKAFCNHFEGAFTKPGTSWDLMGCKCKTSESLLDYIRRFTQLQE